MICAAIIVWFVCGIAGVRLGFALDWEDDDDLIWAALGGPATLTVAVLSAIEVATRKAGK